MNYEFTPLCYVRFVSGLFALFLVAALWRQRSSKGVLFLMLFEIAAAIWALSDGFEAASLTMHQKYHWSQFAYLGISTATIMFLMFAIAYSDHERYANKKTLSFLLIIPVITVSLAFSNNLHHLLWADIEMIPGTHNVVYHYGPYFWVQAFYQYAALIVAIAILLLGALKVYRPYKIQFWFLILASLFPFCASIVYVFKLIPLNGFDPTPVSFILSGFVVALGIFWFRMFNIMPIARKQAVDNLRDGMIVVDSADRIVDANQSLERITGLKQEEVIGEPLSWFLEKLNVTAGAFNDDNEYTVEAQMEVNTDIQDIEIRFHRILDINQKSLGGIYMLTNITTRKMILDAISESNKSRKYELIEKEKLILDLDAYARSVAHDLKNPIASLVNLSELIKDSLAENRLDEVNEMIGYVGDQSRRMIRIIDGLLMLSRIRKEDIIQTPVNTAEILDEVLIRLGDEIVKRAAVIEKPASWPRVLGHHQWLEEVWVNLISNALKYGGKPPVIKLGYEQTGQGSYRFWIQDNGDGLPETSLKKIFRDFERLGLKDHDGYGLGLPIVKRIFEKLGSEIVAVSTNTRGEGCIFSFVLRDAS